MMRNVNEIMFTNSYLLFLKLMKCKKEKEALNESMKRAFSQLGLTAEEYQYMGSSISGYLFGKNRKICYAFLLEEIKNIYYGGKHTILKRNFEHSIFLEEVEYRGYLYSFLVDRHVSKNVVILLDFYTPEERKTEDILFTSINGISHLQNNRPVHYKKIMGRKYCVINTYNAFCSYAHENNETLNINLNTPFFDEFFRENIWKFQENGFGITEEQNSRDDFYFVKFENIIVIFNYNANQFYRNKDVKVRYNVVNVKNVELKNVV